MLELRAVSFPLQFSWEENLELEIIVCRLFYSRDCTIVNFLHVFLFVQKLARGPRSISLVSLLLLDV